MLMDFLCVKLLLFSVLKVFARDELQPSYDSVAQCASSIYAFSFALVCDHIFKKHTRDLHMNIAIGTGPNALSILGNYVFQFVKP